MISYRLSCILLFFIIISVYGTTANHSGSNVKINSSFDAENISNDDSSYPENNNNSIQYHLYTPEHPNQVCYFEPDLSNNCTFNTSYKFKILIHGFIVRLLPGNFFEQIKDVLLDYNKYNVIIVNWTKYDGIPYIRAVINAYSVGINVGKMINFVVEKGVNPTNVHIIGHSLGAHIAGVAGKQVLDLGRVTGLDPAGPLFSKLITHNRLTDTSANFVDVIHTSNYTTGYGLGLADAIGSIDFYPNGGNQQPACQMGKQYQDSDGQVFTVTSQVNMAFCNHNIALPYFMNSIQLCDYPGVECESYKLYSEEKCDNNSHPTDRMGFFCAPIPGLPIESTFYLNTSANAPYCEK